PWFMNKALAIFTISLSFTNHLVFEMQRVINAGSLNGKPGTDGEIKIRRRHLDAAGELMEAYRKEENIDLCVDRIEECEIDLPRLEADLKRRYLYHIQP
ncbi:MAG: hypothetical protein MUO76_13950, partial [Anaerolineaceae bacterium]|nr:hypothetical protein [Anaerolineaceae bacterium]